MHIFIQIFILIAWREVDLLKKYNIALYREIDLNKYLILVLYGKLLKVNKYKNQCKIDLLG